MTSDSAAFDSPQELSRRYGPNYRWYVTITGMVGVVSMVLAMTTVNVAVPDVMGAFGIGQDKAQWMSSAYTATMTAGMLMNAWITGILGERRVFVGALCSFSIGALLGGAGAGRHLERIGALSAGLDSPGDGAGPATGVRRHRRHLLRQFAINRLEALGQVQRQ